MNSKDQLNLSHLHQEKLAKYSSSLIKRGLILAQNIQGESFVKSPPSSLTSFGKGDDIDVLFSQGLSFYQQGNIQKSIEFFSKVLEKCPNHVSSLCFRGFAFDLLENAQDSLKDLEEVFIINPVDTSIHILYAKAMFHSLVGNAIGAQQKFLEILQIDTNKFSTNTSLDLFFRASTQYLFGNKQAALEDCNQALLIDSDNVVALCFQGLILSELGEPQRAIKSLTDALSANPNHTKSDITFWSRGFSYYQLNEFGKAIEDFSISLKNNSNNARVYLYRGLAYLAIENFILGQKDIERGLKIDVDFCTKIIKTLDSSFNYTTEQYRGFSKLFLCTGDVHYELENYQSAIEDYNYALRLDPDNTEACLNKELAIIDFGLENYMEKNTDFPELHGNKSSFLEYVYTLSRFYQTVDKIAELDPDTANALRQSFLKGLHSA